MSLWRLKTSPRHFLSKRERERGMAEIRKAERRTTGEIRVHVERRCPGEPLQRARKVFDELGMARTAHRNGVLIYIALADRRFAIVGDEGVHGKVGDDYWNGIRDAMAERFRKGEFCEGICEAVRGIGDTLSSVFPGQPGDRDELPNEIDVGD